MAEEGHGGGYTGPGLTVGRRDVLPPPPPPEPRNWTQAAKSGFDAWTLSKPRACKYTYTYTVSDSHRFTVVTWKGSPPAWQWTSNQADLHFELAGRMYGTIHLSGTQTIVFWREGEANVKTYDGYTLTIDTKCTGDATCPDFGKTDSITQNYGDLVDEKDQKVYQCFQMQVLVDTSHAGGTLDAKKLIEENIRLIENIQPGDEGTKWSVVK